MNNKRSNSNMKTYWGTKLVSINLLDTADMYIWLSLWAQEILAMHMEIALARHWYNGCSKFIFATETDVDNGNTVRAFVALATLCECVCSTGNTTQACFGGRQVCYVTLPWLGCTEFIYLSLLFLLIS